MNKPIISADSHITEPPETFKDIDPKYKDRAPHLIHDEKKGDLFVVPGMDRLVPMGLVAAAGKSAEEMKAKGKFEDLHRGGWEPNARIKDQDIDGISGEVIYPTLGMVICSHPDFDYKKACFDAYNLWLAEYCSAHPNRLFGVGQTAMRSPEEGIEDIRRIKELGLRGVMLPGDPQQEDYDSPIYDPFWEAAIDLGLPLSFHVLTSKSDNLDKGRVRGPRLNGFLTLMRGVQDIIGQFVLSGVFERHPKLNIVAVEADAGWAPHYMYRMDHAYDRHRYWLPAGTLSKNPSEYMRENIYMTFQDDWVAFQLAGMMNPKRLMWANDFPHSDATWPHSQKLLSENLHNLTEEQQQWILHDNVAGLYNIKL